MAKEKKLYELTDEHRAQLEPWAQRWIANAMSTAEWTDAERAEIPTAVDGLYAAADLAAPQTILVNGPITGAIAATIGATARWVMAEPQRQVDLWGRPVTWNEMTTAIEQASRHAVLAGMGVLVSDRSWADAEHIASTAEARRAMTAVGIGSAEIAAKETTTWATSAATHNTKTGRRRRVTTDVGPIVTVLLHSCPLWSGLYNGGSAWSGWVSYLSFFRHVAKLDIDYSKFAYYERLAELGAARYMTDSFCMVSARPAVLKVDEANLPHCADGPSHVWRDGFAAWHWHGVRVPGEWMHGGLTAQIALNEANAERRRAAMEIYGWANILDEVNAVVIDEDPDPEIGTLLRADLPDAPGAQFISVRCGTGRQFVLPVPTASEGITTALKAQAWMWELPEFDIKQLETRT